MAYLNDGGVIRHLVELDPPGARPGVDTGKNVVATVETHPQDDFECSRTYDLHISGQLATETLRIYSQAPSVTFVFSGHLRTENDANGLARHMVSVQNIGVSIQK
ncbi:hypothetical protein [Zhihengliuella salsuginis]|uniref:Single-stranded DNA-binding protein n=1 Tax=Zhihengliuella salsuginis TaxID=578222 RepID=A0ABQ3GIL7_9MICC|nr:hypothetical protein [Zhihengliuella salsuginis]GHD09072.1 hypothetical protein GCM10008096_21360 [Zhihengliuella salsuginis]